MLGKGLESLIPPTSGGAQGDGSLTNDASGDVQSAQSTDQGESGGEPPMRADAKEEPHEAGMAPHESDRGIGERKAAAPGSYRPPNAREHERPRQQRAMEAIFHIEVEKIKPNPHQPRRNFDEDGLKDLAASIREFGLLQPIVVTKIEREVPTGTEVEYELIAGERRLLASRLLGLERIPAIVRSIDLERERLEMAIIENIQRENLNPIETARAFSRLQDEFRLTQREVASRLGKSREAVANTVRLLDLPAEVQKALEEGKISESHGRLLLTIDDQALQIKLFEDLLLHRMTTRELKNRVESVRVNKRREPADAGLSPEMRMFQEKLSSELGAPVAIHQSGDPPAGGGKVTITFYSEEELRNIVDRLGSGEER